MRAGDILPGRVYVMLKMVIEEEMYTIYTLRTIILKLNTKNDEKECGLRIHHSPAWLRSEMSKQPNSHSSTSKLFAARRAQKNVMHLNMKWWLSHLDRRNSELLKRDAQQHFATTNKDGETEGKGDGDGGRVVFASNNWAVPTVPTVPIVTLQIRRWKRPQIRCQMWFSRKALGRCAKTVLNVHDNLRLINS